MPFIYSIIIFLILLYVMKSFFRYSYDMEDAMILNKSAVDRGMFRGHIYQASYVSLFVTTHCPIYNLMQTGLVEFLSHGVLV